LSWLLVRDLARTGLQATGTPARVWAALLVIYVVWGSTYLGILLAIRTLPVFLMTSLRFLIAGGLLFAWSVRRGDRGGDRLGMRQWAAAAVVGALLFLVGNTGVAWAELRVDTGVASLIVAVVPLWMALFDRVACGQRLGRSALIGLAVGFGGVALLAWPSGSNRIDIAGVAALLVSGAAWAAGSLYSRHAPLPRRPLVSSSMQMLAGGVVLMIIALGTGEADDVHDVSATSVFALAYLIVFGSLIAFSTYAWLLRNARTSLVSTYAYVNPLVAVFLGWAIESEPIGPRTIAAGVIILLAVALIVTPPKGEPAEVPAVVPARGR
jgi:drug/metabolite transporter (DMT)-like permease